MKTTAWMVKDKRGNPVSIARSQERAWRDAILIMDYSQEEMEDFGYTCVAVEITEVEDK